jgi:hypothetical protein
MQRIPDPDLASAIRGEKTVSERHCLCEGSGQVMKVFVADKLASYQIDGREITECSSMGQRAAN